MREKPYYSAMDDTPELARALGRFMAYWAHVEFEFSQILAKLLRTDDVRARMLYLQFPSLAGKLELARRLTLAYLEDGKGRDKLLKIVQDFGDLSSTRDQYVHGLWTPSFDDDEGKDEALWIIQGTALRGGKKPFKERIAVTLAALEEDIETVYELLKRLNHFLIHVLPKLEVSERVRT